MIQEDGEKQLHARRLDQLLHLLVTTFKEYYLHKLHDKQAGFKTNPALEGRVKDVCRRAKQMSDSQVQLPEEASGIATVTSDQGVVYQIHCPGTADANCDCHYNARGEVCKHIIKVSCNSLHCQRGRLQQASYLTGLAGAWLLIFT